MAGTRLLVRLAHERGVYAIITEMTESQVEKEIISGDDEWIRLDGINQANDYPVKCRYVRDLIVGFLIEVFDPRSIQPPQPPQVARIHH
jgi:hypothetical protein